MRLYGVEEFYSKPLITGAAWPTVLTLLALGLGLILSVREVGPMAMLVRDDPGGLLFRRLLPAAIFVPLLLGFIRLQAEHAGFFDTASATGLLIICLIVIFSAIIWRNAAHLSRTSAARVAAEEGMRAANDRIAAILEQVSDCFVTFDRDWQYTHVNPAAVRAFGVPAEQLLGKTIWDMWPGAFEHPIGVHFRRSLQENRPLQFECFYPEPINRWFECRCSPSADGLATFFSDITERKHTEEQISRSQKTFSELVERAPFGIYVVDSRFRIAQMNVGSQNGAFRNVRPLIERPFDEAMRILWPEPVAAEIIGRFRHTLETGEPYYSPQFVNPRHDVEMVEAYEWELHRMTLPDGQHGVICYYFDSTKLREAEAKAIESEEKYRNLFMNMPGEAHLWKLVRDEKGRIKTWQVVDVNPHTVKAWGRESREDAIGRTADEIYPGATEHFMPVVQKLMAEGIPYSYEGYLPPPVDKYFRLTSIPSGEYFLTTGADITDIKKTELALRESEERFRALYEHSTDAIVLTDPRHGGKVLTANPAACTLFGWSEAELMGKTREELFDLNDPAIEALVQRRQSAGVARGELTYRRKDGSTFPGEVNTALFTNSHGEPRTVSVIRDMSERKKAEEELERERKQLWAIIESLDEAVGVWNMDGSLVLINDATAKLYGFEMKEQMLKHLSDYADVQVRTMDGCELPQEEWPPSRVLRGETFSNWELEQYIPSINKRFIGSNSGRPVRDENGKVVLGVTSVRDITERKKAEEQVARERAQLESVFEAVEDGIMVFDMAANVVLVNEARARTFGYPNAEAMRKDLGYFTQIFELRELDGRIVPDEDRPAGRALRGERVIDWELLVRRTDTGQSWIISSSTAPVYDSQGRQILGVVTTRDITARKKAEDALRESEERFRNLFTSNVVALALWDTQGHLFDANDGFLKLLGYTRQQFESKQVRWDEATPPEMRQRDYDAVAELVAGREIEPYEKEFIRPDGTRVPILIGGRMLAGTPDVGVLFAVDITDRKRAEALVEAQQQLLETVVRHVPVGIDVIRGSDLRIQLVNPAYQAIAPGKDMVGKTLDELWPETQQVFTDLCRQVLATGQPYHAIDEPNMIFRSPGEPMERAYFTWSLFRVRLPGDEGWAILNTSWETTERKQAELALEATVRELERSNKELEQFAYISAHDLQEPLRQVRAYVNMLKDRHADKFDGKAAQYFDFVQEGAARMSDLISGLLEYARVGSRGAVHQPTSSAQALATAMANLQAGIDESRAVITHDGLPTVMAEPTQLTQLFQNLIGNAIKFRREGVTPEIHIGVKKGSGFRGQGSGAEREVARPSVAEPPFLPEPRTLTPDTWLFSVKDNGIGIDQEFHEKVFVIFKRLHTREKYPGTGIGLAICKKIVERHGGRIWIESKVGEGSEFFFTLPAVIQ